MKILILTLLFVLVITLPAFPASVCKDINTGAVMECPKDSAIMPWDDPDTVRAMTEKEFEYFIFVMGTIAIVVLTGPVF